MISNFKKINDPKLPSLQGVQDNVREALQPFITNPLLDGVLLENLDLNSGENLIEHKLGRDYRGYVLCSTGTTIENAFSFTRFTPTVSAGGGMTATLTNAYHADYRIVGDTCDVHLYLQITTGGAADPRIFISPPVPMDAGTGATAVPLVTYKNDSGGSSGEATEMLIDYTNNRFVVYHGFNTTSNWPTAANQVLAVWASYEVASDYSFGFALVERPSPDKSKFLKVIANGRMSSAKIYVF
jgi:hypothetical protein